MKGVSKKSDCSKHEKRSTYLSQNQLPYVNLNYQRNINQELLWSILNDSIP